MTYIVDKNRAYVLNDEDEIIAYVTYPSIDDKRVCINHTFVDNSLKGQGVGSKLLDLAYDKIKEQHKKAYAECSFAIHWFEEHPEKRDLLAI